MKYKEQIKVLLLLALVGFLIYADSLKNNFVFDDGHLILRNSFVRSFCFIPYYFKGFLTSVTTKCMGIRPLVMISFNINYLFSDYNSLGYRLLNIFLHILNAYLLYLIISQLFLGGKRKVAIFSSLIFLTHPINVETVTYISSRSDLLLASFVLLSFYYYLLWTETRRKRSLFLSSLFCIFAFLTKETAISFPMFLILWTFLRDENSTVREKIRGLLPFLLLTFIYLVFRDLVYSQIVPSTGGKKLWLNILTQAKVAFFYLRLFLYPDKLSIDHQNLRMTNPYAIQYLSFLLLIYALLIFWNSKKWREVKIWLFWYLIFLLPKFIVTLNFPAMEHHFYLPSLGLYILLSYMLSFLFFKFPKLSLQISLALILSFSILTSFRNLEWKDESTVLRSALKVNPKSLYSLYRLGVSYEKKGDFQKALPLLERIFTSFPSQEVVIQTMVQMADVYRILQDFDKARYICNSALKIFPDYSPAYHQLGLISLNIGEMDEARGYFQKEIKTSNSKAKACLSIGNTLAKRGYFDQALSYFYKVLSLNPQEGRAYLNLGMVFSKKGMRKKAVQFYQQAVECLPFSYVAHYNLATTYALLGDKRAEGEFKIAIKLNPRAPEVWYNLGLFYFQEKDLKKAGRCLKRAERLGYPVPEFLADFLTQN